MTLAIIAAMHEELAAVLERMADERRERVAGRDFWVGHLGGRNVVAVLSGIGKVAAATTATLAIHRFGAQALLFTGVAGGLGEGVRVGDLVVATELLQHDMDASPVFPRHELPLYGVSRLRTDGAMSQRLLQAARSVAADAARVLGTDTLAAFGIGTPAVHDGLIISGDRFVSTSAESVALRRELPDALAVEMEGAAVAQVCHDHGLPLAVLRTISDRADDQAHVDFTAFVQEVARRYTVALVERYLAAGG
ncbi:MAG: 5'-methylthioadenosine/adenosylhomocysteine nucleosidase [Caldimonas sp.]|uniref:5'-methylthioadenosine/adenosylhomocysteine nucleosidase n=1 Tax=Caldimonas sp. TaxID=2838790 RepID=UPI00391C525F